MRKLGHTHPLHRALKLGSHAPASSARSVHLFTYFSWSSLSARGCFLADGPCPSSPFYRDPSAPLFPRGFSSLVPSSVPFSPFPLNRGSAGRIRGFLTVFPVVGAVVALRRRLVRARKGRWGSRAKRARPRVLTAASETRVSASRETRVLRITMTST